MAGTFSPVRTGNPHIDRNLDQLATAINNTATAAPRWTTAALTPGWIPDATVTLGGTVPQYNKDAQGNVWGSGWANNNTAGTLGGIVYTLPAGMRPLYTRGFCFRGNVGTTHYGKILNTGDVVLSDTVAAGEFVALEFVFQAEK